jgi:hypothetical protein
MHFTNKTGESCTFSFTGTEVWYFTDYFDGRANVTIAVDGASPEHVNTASPVTSRVCRILLLEHEVLLTVSSANAEDGLEQHRIGRRTTHRYYHSCKSQWRMGGCRLFHVFAKVLAIKIGKRRLGLNFPMRSVVPGSTSSATSPGASASASGFSSNKKSSVPVGGIVGGTIAAVIVVVSIIAFWIIRSRNRPTQQEEEHEKYSENPGYVAQPLHEGGWGAPSMTSNPHPNMNYGNGGLNSPILAPVSTFGFIWYPALIPFKCSSIPTRSKGDRQ